jgi:serine/threonine protein kinase
MTGAIGPEAAPPDRALSRPDGVVGTRRYMAPERLAGAPASRRSDVYSLSREQAIAAG